MKKMDREATDALLEAFLKEENPEILRSVILELVLTVGFWYRRAQIYKLLHPLFFVAGFVTSYFLVG